MMQPPADESTRMKRSGTLDFGAAARLLDAEPVGQEEFVAWNLRLERLYSVWVDDSL